MSWQDMQWVSCENRILSIHESEYLKWAYEGCIYQILVLSEHIYYCHCRYFLTTHNSLTACIWLAHKIPRLIRSQIFPHMSSLTNLDKSRWQFSFWDKRGHSFSSFTEARLSLLLLLWYSARGIKHPNSQSNIVPFGLKSAHLREVNEKYTLIGNRKLGGVLWGG